MSPPQNDALRRRLLGAGAAVAVVVGGALFVTSGPDGDAIFASGFEEGESGGGETPPTCEAIPPGWQRIDKSWQAAFSAPNLIATASYPQGVGRPVPIPGRLPGYEGPSGNNATLDKLIGKGTITVVAFIALANTTATLTWDPAQANAFYGYGQPRPAVSMFVGLSDKPGSTCIAPNFDPCAKNAGGGSLFWTTKQDANPANVCILTPGKTYYYTFVMADTSDGLVYGEHSCSESAPNSANGCDVQMRHTAVVTLPP